jgi:hypothetical protein
MPALRQCATTTLTVVAVLSRLASAQRLVVDHLPSIVFLEGGAPGALSHDTVTFGGRSYVTGTLWDTTAEWDGEAWLPASPRARPSGRTGSAMAYDAARGVCLLFGGQAPGSRSLGDTGVFDGHAWRPIAPSVLPSPRPTRPWRTTRARAASSCTAVEAIP